MNFYYDEGGAAANALGRLTSMTDGVGGESYQYDALGRVTALTKTISGASYPLSYQYNLASALTSITYPSGRVVQQSYDPIGRLSQITSAGTNYLSNLAYNAAFQPTAMTYGNGVQGSFGYNVRLQLATLAYSSGATTLFSLAYNYGTGNNGQIQSISDNMDGTRTTTYTYDAWARLKTASNTQWTVTESYDRYGNRKSQSAPVFNSVTVDPNTNRFLDPSYSYDAAGNMTTDGLNTLVYDAENRVVSSTQTGATSSYTYDGNSLRVKKVSGGTTTVYIFSGTKVLAEYVNGAAPAAPTREYIYSGSALLAKIEGGTTQYFHQDHLSNRVVTDSTGAVVEQKGHYPFGEAWYEGATPNKLKFTSYERDSESGNDYAMMRYHVNRLGRFSSPDPLGGSVINPQSLNRYAYTANDPVNLIDPSGSVIQYRPGGPEGEAVVMLLRPASSWDNPFLIFEILARSGGTVTVNKNGDPTEVDVPASISVLAALLQIPGGPGGGNSSRPGKQGPCLDSAGNQRKVVPFTTPFGTGRFEFNSSGNLIGFALPLTGSTGQSVGGYQIPANTLGGARLDAPGTVSIGFNNPIQTSGLFGAYIQSATFSAGAFTSVTGAVAVAGIPLGRTSTPSPYLQSQLNQNSSAISLANGALQLLQFTSKNITCELLAGGGRH